MPFDLKDVKQLVELMRRSDLTEFELEQEGVKVRIKRDANSPIAPVVHTTLPPFAAMPAPAPMVAAPAPVAAAPAPVAPAAASDVGIAIIKSPMVGTFYRAASPDSPPFADKGTAVKPDSIVCIIEAMKVMNEIKCEISGEILEVLVENGAPVEFGQPLFLVKTD